MNSVNNLPVWDASSAGDPEFVSNVLKHVANMDGHVIMRFSDGDIRVHVKQAALNLMFLQVPLAFNVPLRKNHFIRYVPSSKEKIVQELDKYYDEFMYDFPNARETLRKVVWKILNDLYVFTWIDIAEYRPAFDLEDLTEIISDEPFAKILNDKWKVKPEMGSDVIEKYMDGKSKELIKLLTTKGALKNESLLPFQMLGILNKFQIPQALNAFSLRTDVNDNIVSCPVLGSAISGLRNCIENSTESLAAKKTAFYNHTAVAESQYFGRKQHLLGSSISTIISEVDCNSTILVDFNVTELNYQNLVGKHIYEHGVRKTLTFDNVGSYVNTTIRMRSPMTCRFRTGVCSTCGGKIFDNLHPNLNIGILSAMHVIEPTTQKILSAKHLIKTSSVLYELPASLSNVLFRSNTNEIRWHPNILNKIATMRMGIPAKFFQSIHDVTLLRSDRVIKEERFSEVKYLTLVNDKGKEKTFMLENDKKIPFLSKEFLLHMRDHYKDLEITNEMVWIPLADTEKYPIFRTIVANDNMLQFVAQVSNFLSDPIKNYTSCNTALQDFSDLIHSKVSANITHIETLLKAYMITSSSDYRVPRVEDVNNVHFSTTSLIMNNRHIGTKFAYQGLNQYLGSPSTYLTKHQDSPFDVLSIGYLE